MAGIELRSSAFSDHDMMPNHYAHDADDVSPPLEWAGVPDGAAELLLCVDDPDAPTLWTHWLVAGIEPTTLDMAEGSVPDGAVQGRTSFGDARYGGPLPPLGDPPHRYFFRLFAVGQRTGLVEGFTREDLDATLERLGELASGTLVGRYQR